MYGRQYVISVSVNFPNGTTYTDRRTLIMTLRELKELLDMAIKH